LFISTKPAPNMVFMLKMSFIITLNQKDLNTDAKMFHKSVPPST